MIDKTTGAPTEIKWPTVAFGKAVYELKFALLTELIADDLGVNLSAYTKNLRENGTGHLTTTMKLFSAMVAHQFEKVKQSFPSPQQWAAVIDELPYEERSGKISEISQAVAACLNCAAQEKSQASAAIQVREPTPAPGPTLN